MRSSTTQRTLADLAALVGGQVVGDPATLITGVADPALAGTGDLVFLLDAKYAQAIAQSKASAVVVPQAGEFPQAQLVVKNGRVALAQIARLFTPPPPFSGIHASAVVDPTAVIEEGAALGPHVTVGAGSRVGARSVLYPGVVVGRGVTVGADCTLHPRVVLYDEVVLGDRVILHAGTVVGSDGYGFATDAAGHHLKIPQMGNVILGDDVELGANVAVDRATFGSTVIGRGTKVDNLVHIGHNDRIGEDVLIVSQTGISGSVTVGDRVTLAGQVGVAGHLSIGAGAVVLARSGITKDVPAGAMVSGFPARPHKEELKRMAALASIDKLRGEVAALRIQLGAHSMEEQPYDH